MKSGWKQLIPVYFVLLTAVMYLLTVIHERSRASVLQMNTCEGEDFRKQELLPEVYEEIRKLSKSGGSFGELLTAAMLNGNFHPKTVCTDREPYYHYKRKEFDFLKSCYEAVWADLIYFPIPSGDISYENTWLDSRDYGGNRFHEGADLFGKVEIPGYYPVISMTDGTVEQIGWLPLGGYRIGIRSDHGGYFYYAHLSEYERDFREGEQIEAGDILGYMGNTGYGAEGTVGQFPVHLHLGIYINTSSGEEVSVNPYWVLRAIHKNIINYSY